MWNHSEGHSGKNDPGGGIHRPYPGFNVAPSLLAKSAQLYNYGFKATPRGARSIPWAFGPRAGPGALGVALNPETLGQPSVNSRGV